MKFTENIWKYFMTTQANRKTNIGEYIQGRKSIKMITLEIHNGGKMSR